MVTHIIDGKKIAEDSVLLLKTKIESFTKRTHISPCLCVLLVGDHAPSEIYVKNKIVACEKAGIQSRLLHLPPDITQNQILSIIEFLNKDPKVNGILIQMPLPSHLDKYKILSSLDPKKDVDGLHPLNIGLLSMGHPLLLPCTPMGILHLIKTVTPHLSGKNAVVIGRSDIVGNPMAALLLHENCTVIHAHSKTENLSYWTKQADIVVSATGRPHLLSAQDFNENAIVIDVGITRLSEEGKSKLRGDVNFQNCLGHVRAITPVPGGVGPMTIASLLKNTYIAACIQHNISPE